MPENEFNKLFSKNLNYYLDINSKTQLELSKFMGVSAATVSNWCKGIKLPRMDKVDMICEYFNINRSDLIQDKKNKEPIIRNQSEKDVEKILMQTQKQLTSQEGLMFEGEPASQESIDSILAAMKIGMELAREKNKKYTPKKYIKD